MTRLLAYLSGWWQCQVRDEHKWGRGRTVHGAIINMNGDGTSCMPTERIKTCRRCGMHRAVRARKPKP